MNPNRGHIYDTSPIYSTNSLWQYSRENGGPVTRQVYVVSALGDFPSDLQPGLVVSFILEHDDAYLHLKRYKAALGIQAGE